MRHRDTTKWFCSYSTQSSLSLSLYLSLYQSTYLSFLSPLYLSSLWGLSVRLHQLFGMLFILSAMIMSSLPAWIEWSFCTSKPLLLNVLSLFTPWKFFTSTLADGLSLKFEWQQVFKSLQVGWLPLVLIFPGPPVPLFIIQWLYQENQLQLV